MDLSVASVVASRPAWWLQNVREIWRLYCGMGLPSRDARLLIKESVKGPTDISPFLALLREQRQKIPQIFLDTRPHYMSKEPPQAEPCHTGYLALFERILESSDSIAAMSEAEVMVLLTPFQDLPQFRAVTQILLNRWDYERRRVWRNRRQAFCRALEEELIAAAYAPQRVEGLLERYGHEGLEQTLSV